MPARASRKPHTMPAGPPPTRQQRAVTVSEAGFSCGIAWRFTLCQWEVARVVRRGRLARARVVRGSAGLGWTAIVFRRARVTASAHRACGALRSGPAKLAFCSGGPLSTEIPGPDLLLLC